MSEQVITSNAVNILDLHKNMHKSRNGKIEIATKNRSRTTIEATLIFLTIVTIYAFYRFDYKNINFADAVIATFRNIKEVFGNPRLTYNSFAGAMYALLTTFSLGALATIFGAVIALFASLLCAKNISNPRLANFIKAVVAFIRAVPTILWVLIFSVAAGLGSVAAVVGLTFHSVAYLIKAYSESIEEMDEGTIEALKSTGASFWQIVFQAIFPASLSYMTAWTFLRFEINFTNAIAVGAAAGAGGIGYDLFMAGSFYFDLRELGFITYIVVIAVIFLEIGATKIKERLR